MSRWLSALAAAGLLSLAGAAHSASFSDIDSNGDGVITQDEFSAAYPDATDEDWTAADTNGDGELTEEELTAASESGVLPAE